LEEGVCGWVALTMDDEHGKEGPERTDGDCRVSKSRQGSLKLSYSRVQSQSFRAMTGTNVQGLTGGTVESAHMI